MAAIPQKIFPDEFSWMKSFVFWLKFHWSLFLEVKFSSIGSDKGLVLTGRQVIIWTKDDYFTDAYMRPSVSVS